MGSFMEPYTWPHFWNHNYYKCECRPEIAINFHVYFDTRRRETNSEFQLYRWAFIKVNLTAVQTLRELRIQVKTRWPSWSTLERPPMRMLETKMSAQRTQLGNAKPSSKNYNTMYELLSSVGLISRCNWYKNHYRWNHNHDYIYRARVLLSFCICVLLLIMSFFCLLFFSF